MRRAQVWVETVIYTLIGLSLIGVVLALITPRINDYRDRAVIEQTIASLNVIDSKIEEILQAPGNTRIVELRLTRGELFVDPVMDTISYTLPESTTRYSEPGLPLDIGRVSVLTTPTSETYTVNLTLSYNIDLAIEGASTHAYPASSTPYRFSFTHTGFSDDGTGPHPRVEVHELSGA